MHHRIPLPNFLGSYLLAADEEPVARAAVFVHGFLGDAYGTWIDFQARIDDEHEWDAIDLYFYKYDSFGSSIGDSRGKLLEFLQSIERPPLEWFVVPVASLPALLGELLGPLRLRSTTQIYEQLVLVGHSLGGVVLRDAIQRQGWDHAARIDKNPEATPPTPSAVLKAELRLFAPAISGARPAGLAGVALQLGGIGGLARAFLGASPSYAELLSPNVIGDIRNTTEKLRERFPKLPALAADVLWPERDDIVIDREYPWDRLHRPRPEGTNHSSVCKPIGDYRQPLDLVIRGEI